MKNKPLLSICIPTCNRAIYLEKTLESIACQTPFISGNEVEIIISDNQSTDNTKEVCKKFTDKFDTKIKYFYNQKGTFDDNFIKVLSISGGEFLKLNNDTLTHLPNSLQFMLDAIKANAQEKPQLFFANKADTQRVICPSIDAFIKEVSYYNTWIGSFGIWKEDLNYDEFIKQNYTQIPQTHILLDLLSKGKNVVIYNNKLFESMNPAKKGGYNIAEVFGKNYLNILKNFLKHGFLSKNIYEKEKKHILLKHINYFYFDHKKQYAFEKNGYFKHLLDDYKTNAYFYLGYLKELLKASNFLFSISKIKKGDQKYKQIQILGLKIKIKRSKK